MELEIFNLDLHDTLQVTKHYLGLNKEFNKNGDECMKRPLLEKNFSNQSSKMFFIKQVLHITPTSEMCHENSQLHGRTFDTQHDISQSIIHKVL